MLRLILERRYLEGAEPSFVDGDVFRIVVPLNEAYSFDFSLTQNEPNEPKHKSNTRLSENEKILLEFIKKDATITQKELSEKMELSLSTIKRILSNLKDKEMLIYVGNKRSGNWIVLKGK